MVHMQPHFPSRSLTAWRPLLILLCAAAIANQTGQPSSAQVFWRGDSMSAPAELLPPPRELRQLVRRAAEAIQNDQPTDAMILLGDWLAGESQLDSDQDYFILVDTWLRRGGVGAADGGRAGTAPQPFDQPEQTDAEPDDQSEGLPGPDVPGRAGRRSLRGYIADGLGSLPDETLDRYEDRHGPAASRLLQQAATARDWNSIGEVHRRYFHTRAGYQATALLAGHAWSMGNPAAAQRLVETLSPWPRAAAVRPAANTRFSASLQRLPPRSITTLGGDSSRNDTDAGEPPIAYPAWYIETTDSQRQQNELSEQVDRLRAAGELAPASWAPVVWQPTSPTAPGIGTRPLAGTQVIARTAGRVWGIDALTGKRLWPYPVQPTRAEVSEESDDQYAEEPGGGPSMTLLNSIFNDLPLGGLAADESRVYFLEDLPELDIPRFHPLQMRQRGGGETLGNTLVALELPSEGKLLWRRGLGSTVRPTGRGPSDPSGEDGIFRGAVRSESSLDDVFFLGPPLAVDGKLFVMAEAAGEIALICIDPADGEELYRQVLAVLPAGSIAADPLRRICGAVPTMHQGVLLCPTAAGVTIAFDPLGRQILWVVAHRRTVQWLQSGRSGEMPSMRQLVSRWSHPAAIADGRAVVLTPVESDHWTVVDLLTGQPRFSARSRLQNHYVAGIRGDTVLLGGSNQVSAYDAETGLLRWSTSKELAPAGHLISGRGVFSTDSGGAYLVPLSSGEIVTIALADGQILRRTKVRFDPGNLTAVAGQLFSQSATQIVMVPGSDSLIQYVSATLADQPDDMTALRLRAERLLSVASDVDNQSPEAVQAADDLVETLRRMRRIDPADDDLNELTVQTMLSSLRRRVAGESTATAANIDIDTLRSLIENEEQLVELLVLQILAAGRRIEASADDGAGRAEAFAQLTDHAIELSTRLSLNPAVADEVLEKLQPGSSQTAGESFGPVHRSSATWLLGRLWAAVRTVGGIESEVVAAADDRVAAHLASFDNMSLAVRERLAGFFEVFPASARLTAAVAAEAIDREQFFVAERMLLGRTVHLDDDLAKLDEQTLRQLERLYGEVHWSSDRKHLSDILAAARSGGAAQSGDDAGDDPAASPPAAVDGPAVDDPVWDQPATLQWDSGRGRTGSLRSPSRPCTLRLPYGRRFAGWMMRQSPSNTIELVDPNGVPRTIAVEGPIDNSTVDLDAVISGGLLVVQTRDELMGLDMMNFQTGADRVVRWRRSLAAGTGSTERLSVTTRLGDQLYRNKSPANTPGAARQEVRLGPVLGDRLLLLQSGRLLCLDTAEGTVRWSVGSVAEQGRITTDGQSVSVCDEARSRVMTFSLLDGEFVGESTLPAADVLDASGPHLLTLQTVPSADADPAATGAAAESEFLVQLRRYPEGNVVVQRRLPGGGSGGNSGNRRGFGRLVDSRWFVTTDFSGAAEVWDLPAGRRVARVQLDVGGDRIDHFAAMRLGSRMMLLPHFADQVNEGELAQVIVSGNSDVAPASAIAAIDLSSGQLAWQKPLERAYAVTLTTPTQCPVLGLVRSRPNFAKPAVMNRQVDLVIIRASDGGEIARVEKKDLAGRGGGIDLNLRAIPGRGTVIGEMVDSTLTLQFGEG